MSELLVRIQAYLDDDLSLEKARELEDWLRADPEHIRMFVREAYLHRQLRDLLHSTDAGFVAESDQCVQPAARWRSIAQDVESRRRSVSMSVAATVVSLVLLLMAVWTLPRAQERLAPDQGGQKTVPFVARLLQAHEVEWVDPSAAVSEMLAIRAGHTLELRAGLAELRFDDGARVVLQGPVTFTPQTDGRGRLEFGKLVAQVPSDEPKAKGFAVETPLATITDLGTEFGVLVDEQGKADVHVFVGEVELVPADAAEPGQPMRLTAGQMVHVDGAGKIARREQADHTLFARMPTVSEGVVPTRSRLIGELDYCDTFTRQGVRARDASPQDSLSSAALRLEYCRPGLPVRFWSRDTTGDGYRFGELVTDAEAASFASYPGTNGLGSATGFAQSVPDLQKNGSLDFGIEYGLRRDFVVQFDAVQPADRIDVTICDTRDTIDNGTGISVFFRQTDHWHPGIGLYRLDEEVPTKVSSGIRAPSTWHNYAVRFNLLDQKISVFVDQRLRGTVRLAEITGGLPSGQSWADLNISNAAVSIGARSTIPKENMSECLWIDNFQIGAPAAYLDKKLNSAGNRTKGGT